MNEPFPKPAEDNIDIKKFIYRMISNWYWFAISFMITLTLAWLVNRYTEPVYQVSTTIMIGRNDNAGAGVDNLAQELGLSRVKRQTEVVNEIEILKSFKLSFLTINKLSDFDITYVGVGDIKDSKLYTNSPFIVIIDTSAINTTGYPVNIYILNDREYLLEIDKNFGIKKKMKFGEPFHHPAFNFTINLRSDRYKGMFKSSNSFVAKYYFIMNDPVSMAEMYRGKLNIGLTNEKGRVIIVKCTGNNKSQEVDFVNTLADMYTQYELDEKNKTSENAIKFINRQLDQMVDSLDADERRIELFQKENLGVDLSEKGKDLYEQFGTAQEKKVELLLSVDYFKYVLDLLNKPGLNDVLPVITSLTDNKVDAGISTVNDLILKKRVLNFSSKQTSPDARLLDEEISSATEILKSSLNGSTQYTQNLIAEADKNIQKLVDEMETLPTKERQFLNIQRKYKLSDELYTFLLQKRAELGIVMASNVKSNVVLDEARLSAASLISPQRSRNYTMGLLTGFLIPLLIIILLDYFNNKIITRNDVESNTKVPIVGAIGHNKKPSQVPIFDFPKSVLSESFRLLRTNFQYLLRESGEKVILVTSTVSGEGKTFCSVNLAAILAMSNKKTLLISIDLRKPRIHSTFDLPNTMGLSSYLIGKNSIEEIIYSTRIPNLSVIPSGPVPPNPAELLGTEKMAEFFSTIRNQFDFIIIDTPPIAVVPDALSIASLADATIFVVRQRYSHKDTVRLLNDLLENKKMNRINILINDIREGGGYGYGYGYAYGYGYGYGYGSYSYTYGSGYYDDEEASSPSLFKRIKKWLS